MPTSEDLYNDPYSRVVLVVVGTYLDETDTPHTVGFSQGPFGWDDPPGGTVGTYCPPMLVDRTRIEQHFSPLNPTSQTGAYSEISLHNDLIHYPGYFDSWWKYSIDGQSWGIYAVGYLSNGTRVEIADAISTPLYTLTGQNIPLVSDSLCVIPVRDSNALLSSPLQPETFSPPCLIFPGTTGGAISLGDNLDITGSCAFSFYVWLENPNQTLAQYICNKGTNFYIAVGVVLGGTISGAVEIGVGAQTPTTTNTAAGTLRPRQWHRVDISIDTAAGTRRIDIDGTTSVTTAGVTGTPTGNAIALTIGSGLKGRLSRLLFWSVARSNATMSAEGRIPILGTESSLSAYFPCNEGVGSTLHDRKSGSSLTGTLGTGDTWGNAGWHLASIAGQHQPFILGTVLRAPVTWIDTAKQIAEISYGGVACVLELQSNHNAVSTSNYSVNLAAGTLTLTSGSISGTYSTTSTANNFWNAALQFSASTTALATITSPTTDRSACIQARLETTVTSALSRYLIGWNASGSPAGSLFARVDNGNLLSVFAVNDAGTLFSTTWATPLREFRTYSFAFVLSAGVVGATDTLKIYVDGEEVASSSVSGNWTLTTNSFAVGVRSGTSTGSWVGRVDEPLIFNRALTQTEIRALHVLPATGAESGIVNAWHFDDAAGSSAAAFVGGTALTLTNHTCVGGRSAAADLARKIYYLHGYSADDLDEESWRSALTANSADCGRYVTSGESSLQIADVILGGLGFIRYEFFSKIYLGRFEGVVSPSAPDRTFVSGVDLRDAEIECSESDPPVWQWEVVYAVNNTRMDQANVAQALAGTDPDRYEYGAMDVKRAIRNDYSIKQLSTGDDGRFPNAESRERVTGLIYTRDAEEEAERLLALHRYGGDIKEIPAFVQYGTTRALDTVAFDEAACDLVADPFTVTGLSFEDDSGTLTVWRPAS